jgi:hypothetical protein
MYENKTYHGYSPYKRCNAACLRFGAADYRNEAGNGTHHAHGGQKTGSASCA